MHARLCAMGAALLVCLALPGVSHAQMPGGMPAPATEQTAVPDEKSSLVAFGLPILTTGLGLYMLSSDDGQIVLTGALLSLAGPSAGHFYTGDSEKVLVHTGVRAAAAATAAAGMIGLFFFMDCGLFEEDDICDLATVPAVLMIGGFVVGTGSAIYSIIDAPFAAERHNRKARAQQLLITPAPIVGPDHATGLGLQVGGRF
jgi:hypothetical protein